MYKIDYLCIIRNIHFCIYYMNRFETYLYIIFIFMYFLPLTIKLTT